MNIDKGASWLAIANPSAGGGKLKAGLSRVTKAMSDAGIQFELKTTASTAELDPLVAESVKAGTFNFISIGGDGSHHHLVNAVMPSVERGIDICLGIIPFGTGNDWIKTLGISRSLEESCEVVVNRVTQQFPVGKIAMAGRTHYFVNVAGIGLDAEVVRTLSRQTLTRYGTLAYAVKGALELLRYKAPELTIEIDGRQLLQGNFLMVNAGIGRFSGGGMQFTPHADPSEGKLAVTLLRDTRRLHILGNLFRAFNGTIGKFRPATLLKCSEIAVSSSGRVSAGIEADGEYLGEAPFTISLSGEKLSVCIPQVV